MATSTEVRGQVDRAARGPWVVRLGRAGLVAKGVLYGVVAVLAGRVAFGPSDQEASQEGAISALSRQPFGQVLLVALAVGLGGYAVWRLAQAWLDPRPERGIQGFVLRSSFVVRALVYAGLCALTVQELVGGGSSSGDREQGITEQLMRTSWGPWVVAVVGAVLVGAGAYQLSRARPTRNAEELRTHEMSRRELRWSTRAGVVGHAARAVVFALAGTFLIRVALRASSEEAVGLDAALRSISEAPYGVAALLAVAVGLFLYGLWCWVLARWGRIRRAS